MCLAIPAQVVELRDGEMAVVDLAGVRKEISLALVEDVAPGDYVIVHVGYALNKLDADEAARTLALFAQLEAGGEMGEMLPG
ncbi:MAG: HypC/HybG/HupF family hydrogenase formation chaperone [Betaproteobacteria bacterium]|nr:HypC/HybG/HupF family hydrogenase formation chaperone [Betaproteobacteria bacterium]MCL2885397.1 HypC/HybG/HupF family hydrogenase formation chaperone [Betaproteobacteria bacterium]